MKNERLRKLVFLVAISAAVIGMIFLSALEYMSNRGEPEAAIDSSKTESAEEVAER